MPNVSLSPVLNAQVVKDNGDPASGWKISSFLANSATPHPTYTDSSGTVAQSNPIILDASGFATQGQIWLEDGVFYKLVLTDENDVPKRTFNDISGVNDPSQIAAEQWMDIGTVASYISANSFSVAGDQVTEYHVGRRVQLKLGVNFVYGYITASSFSLANQITTVTVKLDGVAVLTNALSQSNLSLLRADHHALPKIDYELNSLLVNNITMTGAINESPQVTLPSASTVNIGTANSNSILITGTTTINSFGTASAGVLRTVEFQSSLTLTYNATSMQLPGSSNIVTQAGDVLFAYSKGGGDWKVIAYQVAASVPGSSPVPKIQIFTSNGNFTVPPGVSRVRVTVVGGGGRGDSGGNPDTGSAYINAGGGGGTAIKVVEGLVAGQVIPVVVGIGAVVPLGLGGPSSFGTYCTALGGNGTNGGNGVNGDINISGATGGSSYGMGAAGSVPMSGGTFLAPSSTGSVGYGLGAGNAGIVMVEY